MTGWRIGYLHSDQSVVAEILKVHDSLVTCAPVVSQYAAMGALETADEDVKRFNAQYRLRRDLMCSRLDRLPEFFATRNRPAPTMFSESFAAGSLRRK